MEIRKCKTCKVVKTIDEFYKYKPKARSHIYTENVCKWCKKKRNKLYYSSDRYFKKKYNLTTKQVVDLGTVCAICGNTEELCVDHDHINNRVRGRLCQRCNTGLGLFLDNTTYLKNAILYLQCQKM